MKKVAHIVTTSLSHKILLDKLNLLKKKGYEIHIISSKEGYKPELLEPYDFKIKFVHMNRKIKPLEDIVSVIKLSKLLKQEKYDIVHTHTAKAGIIGRVAAKLAGVPLVIHTYHGVPFYKGQNIVKRYLYYYLEKFGCLFSDVLCSQNKEDLTVIKRLNRHKPVIYEGNGVDINKLDEINSAISDRDLDEIYKKYDIPKDVPIILVGARFEPVKDHFFLLDSLYELKKVYNDHFICLLAGQGELETDIRKRIAELGLEGNVIIVGHQLNIYPFIKLSDIVCLTSEKEGIPRILMESMAFRKPIVASNVLGTRELIEDKISGYLVQYKNAKVFAKKLLELINCKELQKTFGENGRKIVENNYTEQLVVERIHNVYIKYFPNK